MNVISLNHLSPKYLDAEKMRLSDIWEEKVVFNKGERIQIVAPSGSGKTSLLQFLYGMRNDYAGEIFFDDQKWTSADALKKAEVRSAHLSIMFQDLRLFPEHSAFDNISIKKKLLPFPGAEPIEDMLARLGISKKINQSAQTCSYGEQQRIAIVRAMQQPFDFLLLDEPFSHLDEANGKLAMALMEAEATKRGAAIIMADLSPIPFFSAERILHL